MGEGAEKTSSLNTDAVPAELVAATDGKSTSLKLSLTIKKEMMIKKGIPVKKAIVITAHSPRSTVTKQKEAVKDVVTAKSKDDSGNKASFTPPLKMLKK